MEFYRALTKVKTATAALKRGEIWFQPSQPQIVHFTRTVDRQVVHVFVNGSSSPVMFTVNGTCLLARYGRMEDDQLNLYQWGCAIVLEER